ncbi:hypothetical protein NMH_2421 [Neisseria meningitidis H44/76]|uniref:Uncharacterized protein n=1 Tax=Neisseria meningitidis serogroup B / serotype 15 (strain H44/76) TaxID=909420 RepID=E6N0C6_NEIMH|nr:hypothetical protein NMH_2421 [Neisseria meningitidis H44/76]
MCRETSLFLIGLFIRLRTGRRAPRPMLRRVPERRMPSESLSFQTALRHFIPFLSRSS